MKKLAYFLPFLLAGTQIVSAEDVSRSEFEAMKRELAGLSKTVQELNRVIAGQKEMIAAAPKSEAKENAASAPKVPAAGQMLPEIGVVADIVGNLTQSSEDGEGNNRISAREVELVLGHDVDPYSRLDATIALSDLEDVELEEAYVSYWDLPADAKSRLGRFHPAFGKANAVHRDSLETVDEPLVVQRYLGEHGLTASGFDLAAFTPLSGDSFTQKLSLGLFEGGAGHGSNLFGSADNKPNLFARLGNVWDLDSKSSVELGGSWLAGSDEANRALRVNLWGLDVTALHKLDQTRRIKFQSEVFLQNRSASEHEHHEDEELGEHEGEHEHEDGLEELSLRHEEVEDDSGLEETEMVYNDNSWGFYSLLDYRFAPQWSAGLRYDWLEPVSFNHELGEYKEKAVTGYLTFYQSEFARWRAQYQYAETAAGEDDNRVMLQGVFAIGTHKHAIQ